jgi:hypothetical protein
MNGYHDENPSKGMKQFTWDGKKDSWRHAKKFFESSARSNNSFPLLTQEIDIILDWESFNQFKVDTEGNAMTEAVSVSCPSTS